MKTINKSKLNYFLLLVFYLKTYLSITSLSFYQNVSYKDSDFFFEPSVLLLSYKVLI